MKSLKGKECLRIYRLYYSGKYTHKQFHHDLPATFIQSHRQKVTENFSDSKFKSLHYRYEFRIHQRTNLLSLIFPTLSKIESTYLRHKHIFSRRILRSWKLQYKYDRKILSSMKAYVVKNIIFMRQLSALTFSLWILSHVVQSFQRMKLHIRRIFFQSNESIIRESAFAFWIKNPFWIFERFRLFEICTNTSYPLMLTAILMRIYIMSIRHVEPSLILPLSTHSSYWKSINIHKVLSIELCTLRIVLVRTGTSDNKVD